MSVVHKLVRASSSPVEAKLIALCTDQAVDAASTVDKDVTCLSCFRMMRRAKEAQALREHPGWMP